MNGGVPTDLEFVLDPADAGLSASAAWPLAFIDLAAWPHDLNLVMPPHPVIGVGDAGHPLAGELDALLEAPFSADTLIRQVRQAPQAAAVFVQLLRTLQRLPPQAGLFVESVSYGLLQGSAEHAAWLRTRTPRPSAPGHLRMQRQDGVLHLVLDRPQARNAIDRHLRDRLTEAFTLASLDRDIQRIVLRAAGGVFSMGGDLEEFGTTRDPALAHSIRMRTLPALAVLPRADILQVHVQGACVGAGVEMAAFAGRITASARAWFQLPELSMGLIPGAGGCVSVPRRIGRQRTALWLLSGRRINAPTALRWGLIDAIEELPPIDEGGAHVT